MSKFEMSHLVLYAKGWYHHTDSIFRDLRFVLNLEGYSGEYFTNKDIIYKILTECEKLDGNSFKLSRIYTEIQPHKTHFYGYVHDKTPQFFIENTETEPYNFDMAILKYVLSKLKFLTSDEWVNIKPKYGHKLGKPYQISHEIVEQHFK